MRIRVRQLLAVFLVAVAVFAVAAPAFAQESSPTYATPADKECAEKLATGSSVDDCQQSPNPLLPAWNEVIWGMLSFAVLLFLMWKFAMPQVRSMMKAREDRIRDDLKGKGVVLEDGPKGTTWKRG